MISDVLTALATWRQQIEESTGSLLSSAILWGAEDLQSRLDWREFSYEVVGFKNRADAERFLGEFRERVAKFGLELHSEKTRLIEFGRFAASRRRARGMGKPETFTFLGFTHFCGKRRNGAFIVWRKTAKKRLVAKLQ